MLVQPELPLQSLLCHQSDAASETSLRGGDALQDAAAGPAVVQLQHTCRRDVTPEDGGGNILQLLMDSLMILAVRVKVVKPAST